MKINISINELKTLNPLVHCITNPISINQCANALLSLGARPIMAEHPKEVKEITSTANSLLLNLGNITDVRMESIKISAKAANELDIPSVIDLVGVACSSVRRSFASEIINQSSFSVIKGNYSEIKAMENNTYNSAGVDSEPGLGIESVASSSAALAKKHNSVILASGKVDIVTDGKKIAYIKNGTPTLSAVTGTGCMLGAICSAFLSLYSPFDSAIYACAFLGICGELSESQKGNASFYINLLDNISVLTDSDIEKNINIEVINFDEF